MSRSCARHPWCQELSKALSDSICGRRTSAGGPWSVAMPKVNWLAVYLAVTCTVAWACHAAKSADALSIHRHTAHTTIGLRAFVAHRSRAESTHTTLFGTEESLKEVSTGGLVLPVYVVSLASATTRRAKISQQLRDVNAHFTLVEAIDSYRLITGEQMSGAWHISLRQH
ncbi:hypothetical protein WJX73_008915 [Symbiochloris irregularis]|uniref:Uncharacterized protein n=1 Tax=Symbiochloris irregularis TaxID=706552 RepID=A0AAW1PM73_9CHLO